VCCSYGAVNRVPCDSVLCKSRVVRECRCSIHDGVFLFRLSHVFLKIKAVWASEAVGERNGLTEVEDRTCVWKKRIKLESLRLKLEKWTPPLPSPIANIWVYGWSCNRKRVSNEFYFDLSNSVVLSNKSFDFYLSLLWDILAFRFKAFRL